MFNVLIITKEPPDIWLEIFGYEMDVDHGEGEQGDHRQFQPHLEEHMSGLRDDGRHSDHKRLFTNLFCYSFLSFQNSKSRQISNKCQIVCSHELLNTAH